MFEKISLFYIEWDDCKNPCPRFLNVYPIHPLERDSFYVFKV
jgi:hypothetical protein